MKKGKDGFYNRVVKRVLDIICALLVFILFGWLYLILAVLIRLKLGKPILFHQDRPGKIDPKTGEESIFRLYKFRSMTDARDENGEMLPDTERLTRFGRFLRASSLDELPEVWNVLKGEMSWIGPRPWLVSYLPYYTEREHERHLVRPGITGWAQVNGRNNVDWDNRIQLDLYYVDNISFLLDVRILLKTLTKAIKRSDIQVDPTDEGKLDEYRKATMH